MRKLLMIFSLVFISTTAVISAQEFKFGHVNLQEVIYLMPEMDSTMIVLEKYSKDLQDNFTSMQNEFMTKYNTFQQMNASWTPAVLEAKGKELQEMEKRLQEFQQSAQQDLTLQQQERIAPITKKANDALQKVGRVNGFTYIFDISSPIIPYIDSEMSINADVLLKTELGIPLDKKFVPRQAPAQMQ